MVKGKSDATIEITLLHNRQQSSMHCDTRQSNLFGFADLASGSDLRHRPLVWRPYTEETMFQTKTVFIYSSTQHFFQISLYIFIGL